MGTFSKLVTWAFCLSGCFSQLCMTGCEFGMLKNKDLSSQKSALQKGCVWMEVPRLGWWPWLVMLSEFGNLDLRGRRFCSGTWVCLPAPPEWLAPMVETFTKPSKAWDCVQGTAYFSSFGDQRPVLCSLSSRSTGSGNVLSSKICGCHFRSPVPFPPSPSSSSLMGCVFR